MKKKSKDCELLSFKAVVVEVEAYKSVIEGKTLYHAVLDSMKDEPQRQAQFFGLSEDVFTVGDVHVETFSRPVAKSKRKAMKGDKAKEAAKRVEEIAALERMIN